jgi:cysteine synthase B
MTVLQAIGNTPLIELSQLTEKYPNVRILAKFEGANPGGSIKDRTALFMVQEAERSGELTPGRTILEATSGNTGIALAMIGAAKGYRVKLCMPACVSIERQRTLEALGAEVVLTPAREATDGAIRMAWRLLNDEPDAYYMPNQFSNPSNILAHYKTTGPEIWEQTDGQVDMFVAGMGTTGTLMGVGQFLREKKPSVRIIGVEPPVGHKIQGLKNMTESIKPGVYAEAKLDEVITVNDHEAFEMTRQLAIVAGVFVGMSSGAAVAGAIQLAARGETGSLVVVLPDRGDRYLSTNLFQPFCAKCPP